MKDYAPVWFVCSFAAAGAVVVCILSIITNGIIPGGALGGMVGGSVGTAIGGIYWRSGRSKRQAKKVQGMRNLLGLPSDPRKRK
ncbi:MAG: hypothetical protein ABSG68_10485 [Thermoguttaceae bacterium]|jgi:hypothetical protein